MNTHLPPDAAAFYAHVRGLTDDVPAGHSAAGMRVYRHLVHLGAAQVIDAHHPSVRPALGEEGWHALIAAYVRSSTWDSHQIGDLPDDFTDFLARHGATGLDGSAPPPAA